MIMWQKRFGALLGSLVALLGIIISLGFGHMAMPTNSMPNMASDKTTVSLSHRPLIPKIKSLFPSRRITWPLWELVGRWSCYLVFI
jgi:hypothetical protein